MQRTRLFGFLFGAFFALLASTPAPATILFAGGEDVDVVATGSFTTSTTASTFRSGYGRLSVNTLGTSSAIDPPTNRFTLPAFANQSTIWVHATSQTAGASAVSGEQVIGIFGSDGVRRLLIRGSGTTGQVKISTRNAAGTITDLVTCTSGAWPVVNTITTIDWFTNYAVAGHTTLYAAGVQICDFTGDVTTNSVTAVNQVDFAGLTNATDLHWSEIIVSTTDTRSLNLLTCYPVANGTNMTWTGSFANVNGTTANDATPLSTGSNNQTAEFTCPALPAGSFTVPAVTQVARVLKGASGPANFRFIARPSSGSTDYDSGADISVTTNFANYPFVWSTNPACSCAWTTPDVTTGVNFGVVSKP